VGGQRFSLIRVMKQPLSSRDQKGFHARRLPVSTSTASLFTVRPFDRSLLTVWIKDGPLFEGH
jgi:hypothetical protein